MLTVRDTLVPFATTTQSPNALLTVSCAFRANGIPPASWPPHNDPLPIQTMITTRPLPSVERLDSSCRSTSRTEHAKEVAAGARFEFGANWQNYLRKIDEDRIREAERSLLGMLEVTTLAGARFLDIGSGSGLFSLAARRLGASVHSFDYDPLSVACARKLRDHYFLADEHWTIEAGSALDESYVGSLGQFDVVYSWGVLHHTGAMWRGIDVAARAVARGGLLFIAIYNDQGAWSKRWTRIKRLYCSGRAGRALVTGAYFPFKMARDFVADLTWRRNPLARYRDYRHNRGMSVFHDGVDWLGGYPFEVARPEEILDYLRARGFELRRLRTAGGSCGCNEFVFSKNTGASPTAGSRSGDAATA